MKSLYSKFAVTTILIMFFSGILSFLFTNMYYQNHLKKQNDLKMVKIAAEISDFLHSHEQINLNEYLEHLGSIGYQLYLTDGQGVNDFYGAEFRERELSDKAIDGVLNGKIYHGIIRFPHKTFVTGFFANELKNTVGVPIKFKNKSYGLFLRPDIKLLFNEMHIMFGWLVAGMILISIMFVLISTKFLVNPISKLNKATQLIADGHFGIKLSIHQKDEIGALAASFKKMASKLENVNEMRKEFISNISHDIQSPLSNIKGYIKLLKTRKLNKEEIHYLEVVESEVARLSNLTKQLLLLSTIDSKKELMEVKRFDVSEQIKNVIRQYQWNLSEKGLMISYTLPETYVSGDPSLLYSVWENLLTNAIKYNVANGEIDISLTESDLSYVIKFSDTGIGLAGKELERIYDRFYRVDSSRTRTIEGTGLGLSIVYSIIEMHHGEIKVESKKEKGTVFIVCLPKVSGKLKEL
ncbi:sensor histidine kinase [Cytobacillus praedii]|uniref:Heme sensor protein HssS n=1 Tax=Cytobacillus praedii TaxID=1742358 RepID=A0A4R1AYT6_9BACI|nr:HAMP domain-containing sensor histidine kinase [Cytobacillus praedii]TCJ02846.1 HAMP domain-containing histidine kinase [Cytobacillus praedii]